MIEEQAIVTQVEGQQVVVESVIKSTCSQCQQVDSCASGQVAKAIPHKKLALTIPTSLSLAVGDNVIIAIPDNFVVRAAWQVYLWPLFGLILFTGVAQYFFVQSYNWHELVAIVAGVAGGYLGFRLAKFWQQYSGLSKQLVPNIVKKVTSPIKIQRVN